MLIDKIAVIDLRSSHSFTDRPNAPKIERKILKFYMKKIS